MDLNRVGSWQTDMVQILSSCVLWLDEGWAKLLTHYIIYYATLPCPIYSSSEISPLPPALPRTGLVQEADPHGNIKSQCFSNSAFVTLQGPSNYSRGCYGILKNRISFNSL